MKQAIPPGRTQSRCLVPVCTRPWSAGHWSTALAAFIIKSHLTGLTNIYNNIKQFSNSNESEITFAALKISRLQDLPNLHIYKYSAENNKFMNSFLNLKLLNRTLSKSLKGI